MLNIIRSNSAKLICATLVSGSIALPAITHAADALQTAGQPSVMALHSALAGYQLAVSKGKVKNTKYMVVVDFTKPSYEKRLYLYDLQKHKATYSTLVAQGKGSGTGAYATKFSNAFHSHMSSLGTFVTTGGNYPSHHGRAIHVEGLEPGVNDNANSRTVEIHSAWYVSPAFAASNHRVGNSFGCFAVNKNALKVLRSTVGDGSVIYAYYSK